MSLERFKKAQVPGQALPPDVRTFNAPPEQTTPKKLEREFSADEWEKCVKFYQDLVRKKEWFTANELAFYLKILYPERLEKLILPAHEAAAGEIFKTETGAHISIRDLGQYCYLFSETATQILPPYTQEHGKVAPKALLDSIEKSAEGRWYESLLENLTYAFITYPEIFSSAILEKYRPQLFTFYQRKAFDNQLGAAAYLRILYPGSFSQLEISREIPKEITHLNFSIITLTTDCRQCAFFNIITQPKILGLTNSLPETGAELTDTTPEQPLARAI